MADTTSTAQAPGSAPWFVIGDPSSQGLSTTVQDAAANTLVNGIANDLSGQNTQLIAALQTLLTAINNQPSHA